MSADGGLTKLGYLDGDFHFFHLCDSAGQEHETHYHEFAKLVIFLSGRVDYLVEGTAYPLQPWDMLLIAGHLAHKAVIDTSVPYERMIFYIDPEALKGADVDLMQCFYTAEARAFYLVRPSGRDQAKLSGLLRELEQADRSEAFGAKWLEWTYFQQLMVHVNRMMLTDQTDVHVTNLGYDSRIADVIAHINKNLGMELTVDALAQRSYMSKYHFMRLFKQLTGYTVHAYVQQKRLLRATELLKGGVTAADAAERCGFRDYSTFQRAFKTEFGLTPSVYVSHVM